MLYLIYDDDDDTNDDDDDDDDDNDNDDDHVSLIYDDTDDDDDDYFSYRDFKEQPVWVRVIGCCETVTNQWSVWRWHQCHTDTSLPIWKVR